jgi:hypothetical protein
VRVFDLRQCGVHIGPRKGREKTEAGRIPPDDGRAVFVGGVDIGGSGDRDVGQQLHVDAQPDHVVQRGQGVPGCEAVGKCEMGVDVDSAGPVHEGASP